jgi:hypothetical protein
MLLVVLLLVIAVLLALIAVTVPALYLLIFVALLLLAAALASRKSRENPDGASTVDDASPLAIELVAVLTASVLIVIIVLASLAVSHGRSSPRTAARPPAVVTITPTAAGPPTPRVTVTATASALPQPPRVTVTAPAPVATGLWYETVIVGVHLRTGPSTSSPIVATMPAFGSWVNLSCYQVGQSIFGDPYWYRATYNSQPGYVSGFYVDTGDDLARAGLHAC